ncbi:MAG: 4Fe-4S dicluster domain-containing protein [Clostridiales bacterium]|nr:4Fe-4S dicluster domain-containing protein [Clostridiales bacterium]
MRGLHTPVSELRKSVFVEVARIAFESGNVKDDLEALPYKISPTETPKFGNNIYQERAILAERARLAMGLSLRPANVPVHITSGLDQSTVEEIYYEPPLMQVIPSACNACEDNVYEVSNLCRNCLSHNCVEVCPVGAVSMIDGHSHIDQEKCIKCGKCKASCPYDAIGRKVRPCSLSCGVKAIGSDELGRAVIDNTKCLSCGMCMVNCPFGAIADKSQFFQMIRAMKSGDEIVAEIAPAYIGQFGPEATKDKIVAALKQLGFSEVYEVALGADIGAISEARDYVENVIHGDKPFALTSCCPSWAMLAKTFFPEVKDQISLELTPMVATARSIKQKHPDAKVVFIGPCASKKLEAMRRTVRSDVDFVITFEELDAIFTAKGIDPKTVEAKGSLHDATGAGRGYAVAGGVMGAIKKCIEEYYPDETLVCEHYEGLADCKTALLLAKNGKKNGMLIEGMACPGGCVAGAGTLIDVTKAKKEIENMVKQSTRPIPDLDAEKIIEGK